MEACIIGNWIIETPLTGWGHWLIWDSRQRRTIWTFKLLTAFFNVGQFFQWSLLYYSNSLIFQWILKTTVFHINMLWISPPCLLSSFPLKSTPTDESPTIQLIKVYSSLLFSWGERERLGLLFFALSCRKAISSVQKRLLWGKGLVWNNVIPPCTYSFCVCWLDHCLEVISPAQLIRLLGYACKCTLACESIWPFFYA